MSLQALTWVFDHSEAGGNDRLVMISLGHHADNDGFVSLARATVADETRLAEITVKRIIDRLVAGAEVADAADADPPAWWTSIATNRRPRLLRLVLFAADRLGVHGVPPGDALGVHGVPPDVPPVDAFRGRAGGALGDHHCSVTSENAPRTKNVEQVPRARAISSSLEAMEEEFAIWWKNYPRKTAKQVARKAYAARRNEGVDAADLLTAAKSYAYEREGEPPKFTMHAATFLGPNERWRDSMPTSGHADDDEDDPGPSFFDTLAGRR